MKKQNYSTPAIILIDMKTYGIMDIQGESRWRVDSQNGDLGDEIDIINGNPDKNEGGEFIIDAKQYKIDLWGDDELSEDDY